MYQSLSFFWKITVVKTFVLCKISHIAAVLQFPSYKKCNFVVKKKNQVDKVKNRIVPTEILPAPKEFLGSGLHNKKYFWSRRIQKISTWRNIHLEDLGSESLVFDPFTANESLLKMSYPMWCEVYMNITKCKDNQTLFKPWNILLSPILGQASITKNQYPMHPKLDKGIAPHGHSWQQL